MTTNEKNDNEEDKVRSKTLLVLGLTFLLPILLTLAGVWFLVLAGT